MHSSPRSIFSTLSTTDYYNGHKSCWKRKTRFKKLNSRASGIFDVFKRHRKNYPKDPIILSPNSSNFSEDSYSKSNKDSSSNNELCDSDSVSNQNPVNIHQNIQFCSELIDQLFFDSDDEDLNIYDFEPIADLLEDSDNSSNPFAFFSPAISKGKLRSSQRKIREQGWLSLGYKKKENNTSPISISNYITSTRRNAFSNEREPKRVLERSWRRKFAQDSRILHSLKSSLNEGKENPHRKKTNNENLPIHCENDMEQSEDKKYSCYETFKSVPQKIDKIVLLGTKSSDIVTEEFGIKPESDIFSEITRVGSTFTNFSSVNESSINDPDVVMKFCDKMAGSNISDQECNSKMSKSSNFHQFLKNDEDLDSILSVASEGTAASSIPLTFFEDTIDDSSISSEKNKSEGSPYSNSKVFDLMKSVLGKINLSATSTSPSPPNQGINEISMIVDVPTFRNCNDDIRNIADNLNEGTIRHEDIDTVFGTANNFSSSAQSTSSISQIDILLQESVFFGQKKKVKKSTSIQFNNTSQLLIYDEDEYEDMTKSIRKRNTKTSSSSSLNLKSGSTLIMNHEKPVTTILKNKKNVNKEREKSRAMDCDDISVEHFFMCFEEHEKSRLSNESKLSDERKRQIYKYFQDFKERKNI
ncbi:hypothetical protein DASC09_045200 [Saccharomycopsis crataegensis]|uniref:Uncharacterized protein n=1 Tax=Saccharomycopsis crataegensis TaxID=43959 RepID=A0AAV5QQH6_9ASCO|nr:hypothetical protein DASC09_045200 [Saccharomycopsis crataegensis]